jgi:hypothetical protein
MSPRRDPAERDLRKHEEHGRSIRSTRTTTVNEKLVYASHSHSMLTMIDLLIRLVFREVLSLLQ